MQKDTVNRMTVHGESASWCNSAANAHQQPEFEPQQTVKKSSARHLIEVNP
jgi:hypothetical protein